jgi:antitoxin (DNA-binding transcriptional repressor) of toxin-antitoxin stability system
MKVVGIKVLKDNLSKYLRLVREGETVLVMDRDEVVAELHQPTRPVPSYVSPWEAFLNDEARRGSVRRATAREVLSLDSLAALPRPQKPIDLQRLLADIKAQ